MATIHGTVARSDAQPTRQRTHSNRHGNTATNTDNTDRQPTWQPTLLHTARQPTQQPTLTTSTATNTAAAAAAAAAAGKGGGGGALIHSTVARIDAPIRTQSMRARRAEALNLPAGGRRLTPSPPGHRRSLGSRRGPLGHLQLGPKESGEVVPQVQLPQLLHRRGPVGLTLLRRFSK